MTMLFVAVALLLTAAPFAAAQDCTDTAYCVDRGVAYTNSTGACKCTCTSPYYGYRCYYNHNEDTDDATVDCGDAFHDTDEERCTAASQCFWNASSCSERTSSVRTGTVSGEASVPWCYEAFPLIFKMFIFAVATIAFGCCIVGATYLTYYHTTFVKREDSGERVFNQFYNKSAPIIAYCAVVVVISGCLAVTAFYNLIDEDDCTYVVFVYLYILIQILPIVLAIKWIVEYIMERNRGTLDPDFRVDNHVKPKREPATRDPLMCQVRCY